jgi:phospholipase/carboxylesterase
VTGIGPLIADPQFALRLRMRAPAAQKPASLLVLLHGVGGNETNLVELAADVAADTLVVFPRGPLQLGQEQFAWFRVAFTASGPQPDLHEAEQSRQLLIHCIEQLQAQYAIEPRRTTIAGFSQGGIMSASVALTAPERVAAFAVLCGRILPEIESDIADPARLSSLRAFIGHGQYDTKLPVFWAERSDAWLNRLGVAHVARIYATGHELGEEMRSDFLRWLNHDA